MADHSTRVAPGVPCDCALEAEDNSSAWLVADAGGGEPSRRLTTPMPLGDEPGSIQQSAWVRGSIGATIIFVDEVAAYHCGAHGYTTATFGAVDIDTGTAVAMPAASASATAAAVRSGSAALTAMMDLDPDADLDIGASLPRWTSAGVAARLQIIGDACYACSIGDAGSYRAATWVDAPVGAVPWDEATPELPAPLLDAMAGLGDAWVGLSWGRSGPAWDDAFTGG